VYIHTKVYDSGNRGLGGRFKYLTKWNIVLQTIYFGLSFLKDLTEDEAGLFGKKKRSTLSKLRDLFHTCIAWPLGMFVLLSFWSLMLVDRELVFPAWMDEYVPAWLNHVMHTTVALFIIVEKVLIYHPYPSRRFGVLASCCLGSTYIIWTFIVAYVDGIWIYPVLAVLSTSQRLVFIALCWFVFGILYLFGEMMTRFLWKNQKRLDEGLKRKIK